MGYFILFVIGFPLLLWFSVYMSQEQCPKCGERGTLSWRYAKKNGGPDLRYANNVKSCKRCGWKS